MHAQKSFELHWLAAISALLLGLALYVFDRGGDMFLLPSWFQPGSRHSLFGPLAGNLPSFFHTLAFMLIIAAILSPWPAAAARLAIVWWMLEFAFEAAQSPALAIAIRDALPPAFDALPFAAMVKGYFLSGTFDVGDMVAIAIAGALCLWIMKTQREEGRPE